MTWYWPQLGDADKAVYRVTAAFLHGRLEERDTVRWALDLSHARKAERAAVLDVLNQTVDSPLKEPWASVWRLVEESWATDATDDSFDVDSYRTQQRLRAGDRSGTLVRELVKLVEPQIRVTALSGNTGRRSNRRPKKVEDLVSVLLTSGKLLDEECCELAGVQETAFLLSLADALEAAVAKGLDIANRMGWNLERDLLWLGQLHCVYYLQRVKGGEKGDDPDEFNRGIAPSVKLLHCVVRRLADIDRDSAITVIARWRSSRSLVHVRLWAAMARDSLLVDGSEVGEFLVGIDRAQFWNLYRYPEIAELRAVRFNDLGLSRQKAIVRSIKRMPPRSQWPRSVDNEQVVHAQKYWAARELRRIEVAGGVLLESDRAWLADRIKAYPDLEKMSEVDHDLWGEISIESITFTVDKRFDKLAGADRVCGLEEAIAESGGRWDNNPSRGAVEWIAERDNASLLITDLEEMPDHGAGCVRTWDQLLWTHSPRGPERQREDSDREESSRVIALLRGLPVGTIRQTIESLTHWLWAWKDLVVAMPFGIDVWLKAWPIAVEVSNSSKESDAENELVVVPDGEKADESFDSESFNSAVGRLAGVFLEACPNLEENPAPFENFEPLAAMRDALMQSTGRAGLIVRHRLIEFLPYFLAADRHWAEQHLVTPLVSKKSDAVALWRAVARRVRFHSVLDIIGSAMVERATDRALSRETRRTLVFSLVVEGLYGFLEMRKPAVPNARIQQMLRSLEDEVRAYAADAVFRFQRDLSKRQDKKASLARSTEVFETAVRPFLSTVWPQDYSLATPGVSKAFARLPAAAGNLFADAVDAIAHFLVPFDCWSIADYDLRGEVDGGQRLDAIDTAGKAAAFLRMLDLTIGTAEGAVVPIDLADALERIRKVAPALGREPTFERLATAARR